MGILKGKRGLILGVAGKTATAAEDDPADENSDADPIGRLLDTAGEMAGEATVEDAETGGRGDEEGGKKDEE